MKYAPFIDPFFFIPIGGLAGIGLFLISTTASELFIPQLTYFGIGVFLLVLFSTVESALWRKFAWFLYFISLILIAGTFLGPQVRGSTRWIDIFSIRLQPSELIKPFLILVFSHFMTIYKPISFKSILLLTALFLPILILIFFQPDLGNVLVYCAFFIALFITSGLPLLYMGIGMGGFSILLPLLWHVLKEYQRKRIISFLDPYADPIGAGYNALQAMIAIGSGRILGHGLGKGTQSRLLFLPEYHTDFVYAFLGEELGFVACATVLFFYFILLWKILSLALTVDNEFDRCVLIGIFAQLFTQVFINIGMNIGLVPITGITLPFISYGGSSLLSTCIDLGLVLGIAARQRKRPLVIR